MTDSARNWITALAAIFVSLVVAFIGAGIQLQIAEQENSTTFVMLAAQILSVRETEEKNTRLRGWAVDLLNKFSPVPFPKDVQRDLAEGRLNFTGWQPGSWQPGSWQARDSQPQGDQPE